MPASFQFHRGPYPPDRTLLEGEPCECGILLSDGTTFEMLYLGGHDGNNKLLGGGFQTCEGEPYFIAPSGAVLWDTLNQFLWISNGNSWTGFCPCITDNSVSSSSSSSSSGNATGGGSDLVITSCCPSGLPLTLHATVSNLGSGCSCLEGSFALTWNAGTKQWESQNISCNGGSCIALLACIDGQFNFGFSGTDGNNSVGANSIADTFTCSPLEISKTGWNNGNINAMCPANETITWVVTE